jgi:hypothetical protein
MKKLIFILLLLAVCKSSFAQLSSNGWPADVYIVSLGPQQNMMNNPGFDAWSRTNYNKRVSLNISPAGDLAYFGKKYDGSLNVSGLNGFVFVSLYAGYRLTSLHSKISSWLNFGVGGLEVHRYDIAPINYTPTPDEIGEKNRLQYNMTFFELSSRNYLNNLHWRIGRNKKTSLNAGFYVTAGYDPLRYNRTWKYGHDDNANTTYDDDGGSSTPFNSVTIHNIPVLNRFFMQAGIFVGIGN